MTTIEKDGKLQYVEDDRFEGLSKEIKKLMRYRERQSHSWRRHGTRNVKLATYIKPIRTHHCQVATNVSS